MPTVPSAEFVPSVAPTEAATPSERIHAPAEAFGGASAAATEGLGTALERSGNEIFARAVALQQLQNETEARDADSNYMIKAGDLHANYNALQGKDRVDAFPKYAKDLQDLRVKLRGDLSNPMAQKMYDSSSLSTMGRSIFNGAGAAAAAQKEWTIGSTKAQLDIDTKTIGDNPRNDGFFNAKLEKIQASAASLAAQQGAGAGSPQEQDLILKATSRAWATRIQELSTTAPFEAAKMLDTNRTQLTQDDYKVADSAVRAQSRAVGSVNIADSVYNPDKSLRDMETEATDKAKALNPDDPVLVSHAVAALRTKYNQDKYATAREQATNSQMVMQAIQGGVKNDQELLADPKVAAAYNALPSNDPLKRKPLNYQINNYNNERDQNEQLSNFTRLRGMAGNDQEAFLNTDLQEMKLNPGQRSQILALRDKVIKQEGGDLRVQHALMDIRGARASELQAAGIYRRDPNNPDDYDKFSGALQGALDDYLHTNKKPADYDTIVNKIAPKLMRSVTEEGRFYGTNQTPTFKPSTYTPAYKKFDEAYKANTPTASDEQTYRAYQRFQWKLLNSGPSVDSSK